MGPVYVDWWLDGSCVCNGWMGGWMGPLCVL